MRTGTRTERNKVGVYFGERAQGSLIKHYWIPIWRGPPRTRRSDVTTAEPPRLRGRRYGRMHDVTAGSGGLGRLRARGYSGSRATRRGEAVAQKLAALGWAWMHRQLLEIPRKLFRRIGGGVTHVNACTCPVHSPEASMIHRRAFAAAREPLPPASIEPRGQPAPGQPASQPASSTDAGRARLPGGRSLKACSSSSSRASRRPSRARTLSTA